MICGQLFTLSTSLTTHKEVLQQNIKKKKDETSLPEASLLPILVWEEKKFILARHEVKSVDEI